MKNICKKRKSACQDSMEKIEIPKARGSELQLNWTCLLPRTAVAFEGRSSAMVSIIERISFSVRSVLEMRMPSEQVCASRFCNILREPRESISQRSFQIRTNLSPFTKGCRGSDAPMRLNNFWKDQRS